MLSLRFDPAKGPVHVQAHSDWLELLRTDIRFLRTYPYACNEQSASKLKGLLWEEQIAEQLGERFSHRITIQKLIRKLQNNQRPDGYWGWWGQGEGEIWITAHVIEALLLAKEQGYTVSFDSYKLRDLLAFEEQKMPSWEQIRVLKLMKQLNQPVSPANVQLLVETLVKDTLKTVRQSLSLLRIRQLYELPLELDSLWNWKQRTARENWYWKGSHYFAFHDNDLQTSLDAYEILRAAKVGEDTLAKVRNYFLEHRSRYHRWNTLQTAHALSVLLPDVLGKPGSLDPPEIRLQGESLSRFPLDTLIDPGDILTFSKTGSAPIYLSLSQSYHNGDPEPTGEDLQISSWLGTPTDTTTQLKAGVPVVLHAQLSLKKDTDYLLIEIPIPASCSYESKEINYRAAEVHREYIRHTTAIFAKGLKAGIYHYEVKLLPRYTGTFTLNPARVEEMYFPVFYGRGEMRRVGVE